MLSISVPWTINYTLEMLIFQDSHAFYQSEWKHGLRFITEKTNITHVMTHDWLSVFPFLGCAPLPAGWRVPLLASFLHPTVFFPLPLSFLCVFRLLLWIFNFNYVVFSSAMISLIDCVCFCALWNIVSELPQHPLAHTQGSPLCPAHPTLIGWDAGPSTL